GAAIVGAVLTLGATAAASKSGTSAAYAAVGLTQAIVELARTTALLGYSRVHEKEADALALMYLEKQKVSKAVFVNVLKKIRTEENISNFGSHRPSLLSSHPSTSDRLFVAQNINVKTPA